MVYTCSGSFANLLLAPLIFNVIVEARKTARDTGDIAINCDRSFCTLQTIYRPWATTGLAHFMASLAHIISTVTIHSIRTGGCTDWHYHGIRLKQVCISTHYSKKKC